MWKDCAEGDWMGGEVGEAKSVVAVGVRGVLGMDEMEWRDRVW